MSVDLCVYSASDQAVTLEELFPLLAKEGWHPVVVRGYFDPGEFRIVREGALQSGDYVFGWQTTDPRANEYEAALSSKDREALDRWSMDGPALAAADVGINRFNAKDLDPDELADLAERVSPDYAKAIRRAKLEYVIEPHSNESVFLELVAGHLCRLRGGAWTDNFEICQVSERNGPSRRFPCDL